MRSWVIGIGKLNRVYPISVKPNPHSSFFTNCKNYSVYKSLKLSKTFLLYQKSKLSNFFSIYHQICTAPTIIVTFDRRKTSNFPERQIDIFALLFQLLKDKNQVRQVVSHLKSSHKRTISTEKKQSNQSKFTQTHKCILSSFFAKVP